MSKEKEIFVNLEKEIAKISFFSTHSHYVPIVPFKNAEDVIETLVSKVGL